MDKGAEDDCNPEVGAKGAQAKVVVGVNAGVERGIQPSDAIEHLPPQHQADAGQWLEHAVAVARNAAVQATIDQAAADARNIRVRKRVRVRKRTIQVRAPWRGRRQAARWAERQAAVNGDHSPPSELERGLLGAADKGRLRNNQRGLDGRVRVKRAL
jgi:hypothetical protein